MICQVCGKKMATTHVKSIVNGKLTELHLCDDCAREQGYSGWMNPFSFDFGNMLGGLLGGVKSGGEVKRCEKCGASFEEIAESGKIGCAHCYETFRDRLLPMIQRIHGTAVHKGKVPGGSALRVVEENSKIVPARSALEEKRREMQKAIEAQEFEKAAVLRDEIKELEKGE